MDNILAIIKNETKFSLIQLNYVHPEDLNSNFADLRDDTVP